MPWMLNFFKGKSKVIWMVPSTRGDIDYLFESLFLYIRFSCKIIHLYIKTAWSSFLTTAAPKSSFYLLLFQLLVSHDKLRGASARIFKVGFMDEVWNQRWLWKVFFKTGCLSNTGVCILWLVMNITGQYYKFISCFELMADCSHLAV